MFFGFIGFMYWISAPKATEAAKALTQQQIADAIEACWASGKNAKIYTSRWSTSKVTKVICVEKNWDDILYDKRRLLYR